MGHLELESERLNLGVLLKEETQLLRLSSLASSVMISAAWPCSVLKVQATIIATATLSKQGDSTDWPLV